ncbi:hypothetical protein [Singulisphaera sp. PoT]|uniref:hypothetical protein n=1 Tax=Singulisphaera sp. PoT TaxID=3411797 RepID=UPI003BF52C25
MSPRCPRLFGTTACHFSTFTGCNVGRFSAYVASAPPPTQPLQATAGDRIEIRSPATSIIVPHREIRNTTHLDPSLKLEVIPR